MRPDKSARIVAEAAKFLFMKGLSRQEVFYQMRTAMRKRRLEPKSPQWYVSAAAAACMDFPKLSITFISSVLGFNIDRMNFIVSGDHKRAKQDLSDWMKQEGFKDAT